jgi:thiol-disulfide isomerase/thioredoxin
MQRRSFVLLILCAAAYLTACGETTPRLAVGEAMPPFDLPALDGSRVSSGDLQGKPLILNFWTTWCQPCREEIPDLQAIARRGDVQVVGIALDDGGAAVVSPFVEAMAIEYPILLGNPKIFSLYDGFGIPHTVLVDRSGAVVEVHRGRVPRETLERDVERLLAAVPAAGRP